MTKATYSGGTATEPKERGEESPAPVLRGEFPPTGAIYFEIDRGDGTPFRRIGRTQHTFPYLAGYEGTRENRPVLREFIDAIAEATGIDASDLLVREWDYRLPKTGRNVLARVVPGRESELSADDPKSPENAKAKRAAKREAAKAAKLAEAVPVAVPVVATDETPDEEEEIA